MMDELDMIGKAVSIKFPGCTVINTSDLLAGKSGAMRHEVLDAIIAHRMSNPVHGTKPGYSKMAMKLVERVEADRPPPPCHPPGQSPQRVNVRSQTLTRGQKLSSRNVCGRGAATSS